MCYLTWCKQHAKEHGGECLSTECSNSRAKLRFRCAEGHEWEAVAASVKHTKSWCYRCRSSKMRNAWSKKKDWLGEVSSLAQSRGGLCLSEIYVTRHTKLKFKCGVGHEWETTPGNLKSGNWCPYCAGKKVIDPIGQMQEIAISKGGECLSSEYISVTSKLTFRCADGHVWQAAPAEIKDGTWCPQCVNRTESLVRQFFETVFNDCFKSAAPKWLQEVGKPRRVLDGYNSKLRLAFEYHGEQHFSHVAHFHEREHHKNLCAQQERDESVRLKCKENGVTLVEITPLQDGYSSAEFIKHILSELDAYNIKVDEDGVEKFLNLPFAVNKLNSLQQMALSLGGELLSEKYISINSKLLWRCSHGHEWEAIPKTVRNGHWCPYCGGRKRHGDVLQEIRDAAAAKGGRCASKTYLGINRKYDFVCANGHSWQARAHCVLNLGRWCPYCAKNKLINPLGRIQDIASAKGGACLSSEYVNGTTKMQFRCGLGHEWMATPQSIIHADSWCPVCAKQARSRGKALCRDGSYKGEQGDSSVSASC